MKSNCAIFPINETLNLIFPVWVSPLNTNYLAFNIKYIVPALDAFVDYEVPFEGVFELSVSEDIENVEIEEITGIEKIQRLIKNIFRIEVTDYSGGIQPIYFKKCADIAKSIKYYKITRPKDVFSVNEQIEIIENTIYGDKEIELDKLG